MSELHESQPLRSAGKPLTDADAALILIHGRGATAESILPLSDALGASEFAVLAPQAMNSAWYPNRFIAPKAQNEPYLSSALRMLANLVAKVNEPGIPIERLVIGGFSQGACLASEFVAQNPARYGGLLVFSGGLIGEGPSVSAEMYSGVLKGTPVFIGCSDVDFHIPVERVHETASILSSLGAEVNEKIYPGMGHTIIQNEIDEAKGILEGLLTKR